MPLPATLPVAGPTCGSATPPPLVVPDGALAAVTLEVHLLPRTDWRRTLELQHRLVYEISGEPGRAALVLCEPEPVVTVGRQGSHRHIRLEHPRAERDLAVRWTNRGGGAWLQVPGTLGVYPVVPLHPRRLGLTLYRDALAASIAGALRTLGIDATADAAAVRAGGRPLAWLGAAVRNWTGHHGASVNLNVPPDRFAWLQCLPGDDAAVTSVTRELRTPVAPQALRGALVEAFQATFGFGDVVTVGPTRRRTARGRHVRS